MNYFELFDIPVSFYPDPLLVKAKYIELSRKFHPDFYTLALDEEQQQSLDMTALINKAHRTLTDNYEVIRYILDLFDKIPEEGQAEVPKEFLMEMMELNEVLMELETGEGDPLAIIRGLEELETSLFQEVENDLTNFNPDVPDEAGLDRIKDYFLKRKYLLRLKENLDKFTD